MKSKLNLLILIVLASVACTKTNTITLSNPLDVDRADETIVLKRAEIEDQFGAVDHEFAPVVFLNHEYVPSQFDDMDGDDKWDEFVFTLDFKASETVKLELKYCAIADYPEFEKRTNVRLGIKQPDGSYLEVDRYEAPSIEDGFKIIAQAESASWENDKMAFRNYFDCRNIKDLFGKLTSPMILDKVHTPEMPNYHRLNDWGMDVLHCGSSLGSGGLAMLEGDSLYRLGSTKTYTYQKVAEGPVRSVFDLKYTGWKVADESLTATERITIVPGKYWFQSDVTVKNFSGEKQLVTGIVTSKLKNDPVKFVANNEFSSIATLDVQSENKDELGMGVLLKTNEIGVVSRTTDINFYKKGYKTVDEKGFSHVISETYYVSQKIEADQSARHYFFAVWGLEKEEWKSMDNFKSYISSEADLISNPIIVKF